MAHFNRKKTYTDDQLLVFCREGNQDAFRQLWERYYEDLLRNIVSLRRDDGHAEDLAVFAFQKLFEELALKQKPIDNVISWLTTTARNLVFDQFRSNKYLVSGFYQEIMEEQFPQQEEAADAEEKNRRANILIQEIHRLKTKQKEAIILRFFHNKPPRQIAKEWQVPINEVYELLKAAKMVLKRECKGRLPPTDDSRE